MKKGKGDCMIHSFNLYYTDYDRLCAEELDKFIAEHNLQEDLPDLHSYDEMYEYAKSLLETYDFNKICSATHILETITQKTVSEYYKYDYSIGTLETLEGIDDVLDLFCAYENELKELGIENPEVEIDDEER